MKSYSNTALQGKQLPNNLLKIFSIIENYVDIDSKKLFLYLVNINQVISHNRFDVNPLLPNAPF